MNKANKPKLPGFRENANHIFSVNAYPIQFNLFIVVKCINKLTHSAVCESDLSVKVIVNIIIMVWEKVFIVGLFLKTV